MNSTTTLNTPFQRTNWVIPPVNGALYAPSHPVHPFPQVAVQPFFPAMPASRSPETVQTHAEKNVKRAKSFALAAGLFLTALLLRKLPARHSAYTLIPTDWKQWAKMGLGIAGISQLNQGLQWKPPQWLGALQTVLILNPLLLTRFEKNWPRQLAILAPLVATLVQVTHWASEKTGHYLERTYNIPPMATQLAFSAISTVIGIKSFPPLFKLSNKVTNPFKNGDAASKLEQSTLTASKDTVMPTAMTCARGCCAAPICMSELGEYTGAFISRNQNKKKAEVRTP